MRRIKCMRKYLSVCLMFFVRLWQDNGLEEGADRGQLAASCLGLTCKTTMRHSAKGTCTCIQHVNVCIDVLPSTLTSMIAMVVNE